MSKNTKNTPAPVIDAPAEKKEKRTAKQDLARKIQYITRLVGKLQMRVEGAPGCDDVTAHLAEADGWLATIGDDVEGLPADFRFTAGPAPAARLSLTEGAPVALKAKLRERADYRTQIAESGMGSLTVVMIVGARVVVAAPDGKRAIVRANHLTARA
jgi:hypothetical protein